MTKLINKKIDEHIEKLVREHGVLGDYEINIFLASVSEIRELHYKFLAKLGYKDEYHDVLSFPLDRDKSYPDGITRLGDIVVCDQEKDLEKLIEHGCLHLLGIHHEK